MPGGRPLKSGLDYFPLDVVLDEKFELIEAECGIEGFGIIVKLMQKIYGNGFFLLWDEKTEIVFSNRINVNKNSINEVINSALKWGLFEKSLWDEHKVLTSAGIQKRYFEVVSRRKVVDVVENYLLIDPPNNDNINLINVDNNSQRKGKERKGTPQPPLEKIIEIYHAELPDLPIVRAPESIKPKLSARCKEKPERLNPEWWREFFKKEIKASDFLMGKVKDFKANLDWICGPQNFGKIMNGQYVNKKQGNGYTPKPQRPIEDDFK